MAEPAPREAFLPSLLDRLTDDAPQADKDASERRLFTARQLRDSVLRDLTWLLNTGNFEGVADLGPYPFVARSVVNFGIPDLTGWTASSIGPVQLEKAVQRAIRQFEPRILPETLKVRAVLATDQMNKNTLGFEIEGLLWGTPMPSAMRMRTEVDLESGHVDIREFSA